MRKFKDGEIVRVHGKAPEIWYGQKVKIIQLIKGTPNEGYKYPLYYAYEIEGLKGKVEGKRRNFTTNFLEKI
jgi:hypothetical protein